MDGRLHRAGISFMYEIECKKFLIETYTPAIKKQCSVCNGSGFFRHNVHGFGIGICNTCDGRGFVIDTYRTNSDKTVIETCDPNEYECNIMIDRMMGMSFCAK